MTTSQPRMKKPRTFILFGVDNQIAFDNLLFEAFKAKRKVSVLEVVPQTLGTDHVEVTLIVDCTLDDFRDLARKVVNCDVMVETMHGSSV